MSKKRIIFDFGSTYFTIFSEGRLLLRKPSAIILKRTLQPVAVATGEEALRRRDEITEDELFMRPVRKGAVSHREGCKILIKDYISEVFGKFSRPPICVLVNCSLSIEQRHDVEKVFVEAGYADIFLMEGLMGLIPSATERGIKVGVLIGGENTEVGIFHGGKILSGYSVDMGSNTVNERIKAYVRENYKLIISDESAEDLKLNVSSMYKDDSTRFTVAGKDSITGRVKKLTLSAREVFADTAFVFNRILKIIGAALLAAPLDIARAVEHTGILFAGYGSLHCGLRDYCSQGLQVPVAVAETKDRMPFIGAEKLIGDPVFLSDYLSLSKAI